MNTDDVSKKEKKQKQACNTFSNTWNRIYRSEKIRYNKLGGQYVEIFRTSG